MNNSTENPKEFILKCAFNLFLKNNYTRGTIRKLCQEFGFSSGLIYYNFRSKREMFCEVVNKYILKTHNAETKFPFPKNVTLYDFIHFYIASIDKTMSHLKGDASNNVHRHYFILLYEALEVYPNFNTRVKSEVLDNELTLWKLIIKNAANNGEINKNLNIDDIAKHFRYLYSGLAFEGSLLDGLDTKELKRLYMNYYELIRERE